MAREIKFRAWDKGIKSLFDWEYSLKSDMPASMLNDNRFIWMQYTGLYDSKEKPIYEGDIVKQDNGHIWSIDWSSEHGAFILRTNDPHNIKSPAWLDLEVIGNIYENPELLEVKP